MNSGSINTLHGEPRVWSYSGMEAHDEPKPANFRN